MSKKLNSDLMVESFYNCISRQPQYPNYVVIEYRSLEAVPVEVSEDPLLDMTFAEIVLHSAKDIPKILENKIIGFSFAGELIRPIMEKPNPNGNKEVANGNKEAAYTTEVKNTFASGISESKK